MTSSSVGNGTGRGATASAQPLWLPPGTTFASLPKAVQQAVVAILNPAYQRHVLEAGDALERGQGLSYCNLLFLEIVTTYGVLERPIDGDWSRLPVSKGLAALMNVTGQKSKVASFLLALQKLRARVEPASAAPPEVKPASG